MITAEGNTSYRWNAAKYLLMSSSSFTYLALPSKEERDNQNQTRTYESYEIALITWKSLKAYINIKSKSADLIINYFNLGKNNK